MTKHTFFEKIINAVKEDVADVEKEEPTKEEKKEPPKNGTSQGTPRIFVKYYTPVILQIIFALGTLTIIGTGLYLGYTNYTGYTGGPMTLLVCPFAILIAVLCWRLVCERSAILFDINNTLLRIEQKARLTARLAYEKRR